jgi:hypothetical protein
MVSGLSIISNYPHYYSPLSLRVTAKYKYNRYKPKTVRNSRSEVPIAHTELRELSATSSRLNRMHAFSILRSKIRVLDIMCILTVNNAICMYFGTSNSLKCLYSVEIINSQLLNYKFFLRLSNPWRL